MGEPVSGWWRRNALALGALVVLIPASAFAFDQTVMTQVRNPERTVDAGASTTVGDWTFGPVTLSPMGADADVPAGANAVRATVRVDPGRDAVSCRSAGVSEPATDRLWIEAGLSDGQEDADTEWSYCPSDSMGSFDVVGTFVLGDDVGDDLVIELTVMDEDETVVDLHFDVVR